MNKAKRRTTEAREAPQVNELRGDSPVKNERVGDVNETGMTRKRVTRNAFKGSREPKKRDKENANKGRCDSGETIITSIGRIAGFRKSRGCSPVGGIGDRDRMEIRAIERGMSRENL